MTTTTSTTYTILWNYEYDDKDDIRAKTSRQLGANVSEAPWKDISLIVRLDAYGLGKLPTKDILRKQLIFIFTEHHLGGRLRRQPEDNEREEWEKDAGKDEDVIVEDGNPLQSDCERQVRIRKVAAARIVPANIGSYRQI